MKKFKVAMVGCGVISANHLAAINTLDYVEVAALCDINIAKARARRDEYAPKAAVFDDYVVMMNSVELDAVHIATPHYLHADMAIFALQKGVNVFLEKPMCINREEIKKLLDAEKQSKAKITVCFQNRFNPSTVLARQIADDDGGVLSAYCSVFWNRDEKYYVDSGWRGSYATEGGGVMINQAIHTIDLLCQFLGKPSRLWATKANHHLKGIIKVEDTCEGLIEFENGKRANFYTTTAFPGGNITSVFLKTKNHKIEIKSPYLYLDGKLIAEPDKDLKYISKECYGNGHFDMISMFYDALRNGKEMPVSLESAQYAVRVLLAAYKSCDEETPI